MVAPYPVQAGWSSALIYSLSQESFALSGAPCLCFATTPTIHGVGDLQLHLYLLTSRGGTEKAGSWPTSTHSIHFASLHGAQAPVPLPTSPKLPLPGDLSSPSDCACHSWKSRGEEGGEKKSLRINQAIISGSRCNSCTRKTNKSTHG